ncbi:DNA repair protein complementing XP-C cells homolog [Anopheles albimanus]|uniref:Rad4 beta-hairpin domain-containing protein n=1 Tax=Anopheles albimanus TaxID=7167 RepID=A0A182FP79_ANOAL|nr:DNA repair protein complementing XP-C cells homolog [Anopheles albimanus]
MSESFMSESDDEDAGGDFSASEDEWLPEKSTGGKKISAAAPGNSDDSDTDSEDSLAEEPLPKRSQKRPKTASTRRKSAGPAGGKNLNTSKTNNQVSKDSVTKQPGDESDSSGDEYLVDPTKLDFNSKFFDKLAPAPIPVSNQTAVPQFANAVGHLSDSSEAECDDREEEQHKKDQSPTNGASGGGKQLIAKINQMSQAYANFQDFTNTLEMAKNHLKLVTSKANQAQLADQESGGTAIDVSNLLALGEANVNVEEAKQTEAPGKRKKAPTKGRNSKKPIDSDSDWEEVEEQEQPSASSATPQSVQITVAPEAGAAQRKRKCTEVDVDACIKRMINRDKRDAQLVLHKMTIIMGIAHGNYTNTVLNDPTLLAIGTALMPSERCYPKGPTDVNYLLQIMKFFREIVTLKGTRSFSRPWKRLPLQGSLRLQLLSQMANCKRDYVLMFILLLRSIGIHCRMVVSLQVAPKNVPSAELLKVSAANGGKKVKVSEKTKDTIAKEHDYEPTKKSTSSRKRKAPTVTIPQLDGADEVSTRGRQSNSKGHSKQQTRGSQKAAVIIPTEIGISPRKTRGQRLEEKQRQQDTSKVTKPSKPNLSNAPKAATPLLTQGSEPSSSKMVRRDYTKTAPQVNPPSEPSKSIAKCDRYAVLKAAKPSQPIPQSSPEAKVVKLERFSAKTRKALDRRVLSTDDEHTPGPSATNKKGAKALNLWVEAYAEEEKRWIPLNVLCGALADPKQIAADLISEPILYVFAWNNDGSIKDVTARYCIEAVAAQQKLRIMQQWIDDTLLQFRPERSARDIAEDRELNSILEARPLPKTIAEYKCHPHFALKRHLLKFEAIYPPDAPTLGFTSNKEPVYARECVHTLHSREIWLKQARTVKLYESPYKVVAGRPKYDRSSGQMLPSQPVELFGMWQTEEYDPPTAENGIVPRNAYGNVELFKPCMLPKKTVHLRLPALNRICKKLRIDCAQAVTGFDFHGGSSHPVYDGFVVCEEYRDLVVDAWHEEQAAEEQRAREKYEKRVYGNWKRLIKGLLIRQKLQHKYNFDNLST